MKNYLSRAEKFATFIDKPVLFVQDLFNDSNNYWFVVDQWRGYNPSSHIHFNEFRGRDITNIMNQTDEYDQIRFITKYDDVDVSTIKFNDKNWVLINPISLRY